MLVHGGATARNEELSKCRLVLLYIGIQTGCMLIFDDPGFRDVQRSEDKVTSKNRKSRVGSVVGRVSTGGERLRKD